MKSKLSLYTIIGILFFIVVATICPDCAPNDSYEELEWQKSKKIAERMSEEEAYEPAKKEIEKEELDAEMFEDSGDEYLNGDEDDDEDLEEQEKERIESEQAETEAEFEEGFEEDEKLIPNEPITYSGEFEGIGIIIIVDFKTTVVSGSVSQGGDFYLDAGIDGTINIETFEVTATFSGIMGAAEAGMEEPWNGTINGTISDDLSTYNGNIEDDEGGGKFTATR